MTLCEYPRDERPLDRLTESGGYTSIFRRIACIGDSLSSGATEGTDEQGEKTFFDIYEHSWGQYLGRMCGSTVYNFSRGGMTAREYMRSFAADRDLFAPEKAADAYIVALGYNDMNACSKGEMTFGAWDDANGADTFTAYYRRILDTYAALCRGAHFFLVSMPSVPWLGPERERLHDEHLGYLRHLCQTRERTHLIDLRTFGPRYDEAFVRDYYLGGHMNVMGYQLTARMIGSYIDYIVRHNMRAFKQVAFIGSENKNTKDV